MRFCWSLTALFAAALAAALYLFVVRGSIVSASDGRTAILLAPEEREIVLSEMRAFLASTQIILSSAARGELDPAIEAAREVGTRAREAVPVSLMGKLPLGFKSLGFDTHQRFDQLALNAEDLGDAAQVLDELGNLLANCVGCHAAYRIEVAEKN